MGALANVVVLGVMIIGSCENDINKQGITEDKLLQTILNLREHVLTLESHVAFIRKKTRQSVEILKRLEASGESFIDCFETGAERKSRKSNGVCPVGFTIHDQTSCYKVSSQKVTWLEAWEKCREIDAHLVAIETETEQRFLLDRIKSQDDIQHCDFWTGGTDQITEGQWLWNNSGSALTYTRWHSREPNNGGGREHCLWLDWYFSWDWNDATCDRRRACYVCERPRRRQDD